MKPEHFALLRRRPVRIASAVVLVAAVPFFHWQAPTFYLNWFYRSRSVQEMGAGVGWGMFLVAVLFVGTLVLCAAFLSLVPGTRRWFTVLGAGTICGYVLHGFLIRGPSTWTSSRTTRGSPRTRAGWWSPWSPWRR
ncbi:hypothetical protein [Streptomyces bikiniensis]|uniref:hypothetical protein n=1 Tax=Streptomyces bikiniensis TaxID=1896 RepID=UPI001F2D793D|nr:hypothetical protein [Streptomyces bikiniensis]